MNSILYYLIFSWIWILSWIPYRILYIVSDVLYVVIYYIVGYRKKTVMYNLRSSFPEKSDAEIEKLAKRFYSHFGDFLVEMIKLFRISNEKLDKRMRFLNPEVFDELAASNKNFALVSAHYNNWEMLSNLPAKMRHRFLVIYRPLNSKISDRLSLYMRGRNNPVMIPMEHIFREGVKCKTEKKLFSIWFLADQRPPRRGSKFWTKFLNHETAFFEGMEKITRKLEMALVFMDVQKVKRGYYEVRLEKLFDNAASAKENEVALTCIRKMEEEIINKPEFWLWSHKRFKHQKPEDIKLIESWQ